ncbi:hypothetical protein Agub_g12600 [Astrephomene gubernaculifera]|uniref:Uncharacterized protein n=1 Tax=Astrephomene gubernaculifera TaxID=47775 RepID=A0AAD3DYI7_9CHLO|nr:hypothetical protein Agub_g12600 [Astrephomene gubernaculifera]
MRQLLRLLLYLAAGAVIFLPFGWSSYFESAPSCGYTQQESFVHFETSPELLNEPSLGVCGWGFADIPQLHSRVDRCVSCSFTSADNPACSNGVLVSQPEWHLASHVDCEWQGCWFGGGSCVNGTAETTALCAETGFIAPRCCPFKRYIRCCRLLACTQRTIPAGQCVVGDKDLLPEQKFSSRVYAVSTTSSDCYAYSFETTRTCRANRTLSAGNFYESCETHPVGRDAEGCAKLPGYTFYRGLLVANASTWRLRDNTEWSLIAGGAAAVQQAASDMPLMAGRCSATASCAAFQNTGNSTDLLYQLPLSSYWVQADSSLGYCAGIYAKSSPSNSCARIHGYLFASMRTLQLTSSSGFTVSASSSPCSDCSSSAALAAQCDAHVGASGSNDCAGFSNYHGLIIGSSGLLTDQAMTTFTTTPCVGMYTRVGPVFPQEVEDLDKMLCGDLVYCTGQLRYHASSQSQPGTSSTSYYVDISIDVLTDLTLPRGLLDASGGGLQQIPNVRSLTFRCQGGSSMLGGLPVGLVALMPFLQELRVIGCRVTGTLPSQLSQLRYLRVLDLSDNSLTGALPESWSNMTLGYLNLSSNGLTGTLPAAWLDIITQPTTAPPPPPAPTYSASPPPSPPPYASSSLAGQLGTQSAQLVADLSSNGLTGAVPRDYVYKSCVSRHLRIQLRGEPSSELLAALGSDDQATFLLQGNPGIELWSGRYQYAVADLGGALAGGSSNLCGSHQYKIALGVLWGLTGLCMFLIMGVSSWRAARAPRRNRGGFISDADIAGQVGAEGANADGTAKAAAANHSLAARLWGRRWVRRLALLVRVGYLAADVALDVRVAAWLWSDGDGSAAAVCLAFILVTQAAVSAALLASVWHHLFSSRLLVALLSPLLVAVGPLVGPVLAVANIKNSDVPLVFWRYLELVEFCVALLQAPAESVTQSIVYARQNLMGNGMYMDHGLFVASIILSMGDMLIALLKLCSYKRGPFRRVLVAITHLDKVRDPVDYRRRLLGPVPESPTTSYLETPLNPPGGAAGRGAASLATSATPSRDVSVRHLLAAGMESSPLPPPSPMSDTASSEQQQQQLQDAASESSGLELQTISGTAVAHTFTPLTAPRYRPSLLATSANRLAGPSGPVVVGGFAPPVLSRLAPPNSGRTSCVTIPAHPPLKPLLPSLPVTPRTTERGGSDAGSGFGGATAAEELAAGPGPGSQSLASAGTVSGMQAEQQSCGAAAGLAGSCTGGMDRPHRSLQEGLQPQPPLGTSVRHSLVGSLSSDAAGMAGTGGVGPPSSTTGKPLLTPVADSQGGASSLRPVYSASARSTASSDSCRANEAAATAAASPAPPHSSLPPVGPSGPDESRYLASAAVAAEAALSEAEPASSSGGPGPGALSPAGLIPSPRGLMGSVSAGPRRQVSLRSRNGSPARRREGPSLSIAVPASSVPDQGIEVIRMSTQSSLHNMSPASSRGASTPTDWLPRPPQLPPSSASLPSGAALSLPQSSSIATRRRQQQRQQEQSPQQPPEG